MKRVTSLGGIFIKYQNPESAREWYNKHLGIQTDQYGTSFEWRKTDKPEEKGFTVWSTFKKDTTYFAPSEKDFMINFRVENLEELLKILKEEGVTVLDEIESLEYGKFAHILDPEGNKIELWEANDAEYEKILGSGVTK
ncbi:MAG: VOC family protein [Fimbriimonadaceae bacterium]|nr:VOC family protein [Chitinophagales bacterium]